MINYSCGLRDRDESTNVPRLAGKREDRKDTMQGVGGVEDDSQALA